MSLPFGFNYGMISEAEEAQLKARGIKGIKIPGRGNCEIVCKLINRDLHALVLKIIENCEENQLNPTDRVNEKIFDSCLVWPQITFEDKQNMPVGTIPSIVKIIMEKSGFILIDVKGRPIGPDVFSIPIQTTDTWDDITETELTELQKEFPVDRFDLKKSIIDTYVFIQRPMTKHDLTVSKNASDPELAIAKATTVWPKNVDWDSVPAGIVDNLVKALFSISGWDSEVEVEELV